MSEIRRTYTEEFKKEAVKLSRSSDKTLKEVADDLGTSYQNLNRWRKKYKENGELAFPGHGNQSLTPEEEEVLELKKELRETKTERDILKKAVAIFSKTQK